MVLCEHMNHVTQSNLLKKLISFSRIETILDSDRVLVMDNGQVAEFGSPEELRKSKNSLFSTLVNQS